MESPIFDAIRKNNIAKVRAIVRSDPTQIRTYTDLMGETPLQTAIYYACDKIAALLLKAGADVNEPDLTDKNTPLHYAAKQDYPPALAEMLLKHGADKEKLNRFRETPLFVAGMQNHDVARLIVQHGAYYDLNTATHMRDAERVRQLLQEDPKLNNVIRPTFLLEQAIYGGSKEVLKMLLEHGVDPDKGRPPIFLAVEMALNDPEGDMDRVRMLLEHGADPTKRCDSLSLTDYIAMFKKHKNPHVRKLLSLVRKYSKKADV